MPADSGYPSISDFFQNRSVLVTGATGFVGKVLLEKLLRSCRVRNVYTVIRAKKGQNAALRLESILKLPVFDKVKSHQPDAISKIIPMDGDIMLPELGLSQDHLASLVNSVSIVFHCAATVRFSEQLRCALNMNVLGTKHIIDLCRKLTNVVALVHMSTAYSNCDKSEIDEIVYPTLLPPSQLIEASKWMSDEMLDVLTPVLLRGKPNTYTFTKALAENLLVEERQELPVAIVRPSIVAGSWKEPMPGWVEGWNGAQGITAAGTCGLLRTMMVDSSAIVDLIPVDIVVNMAIAVAWYTATVKPKGIRVYHCCSGGLNSITWDELKRIAMLNVQDHPSSLAFRPPGGTFKTNRLWHYVCALFQHHLVAIVADAAAYLMGNKPRMLEMYAKLHRATDSLEFFTLHHWKFSFTNVFKLHDSVRESDKQEFYFDVRDMNWKSYIPDYETGIRQFLLKDPSITDPTEAKRSQVRMTRLRILEKLIHVMVLVGITYLLAGQFFPVPRICFLLLGLCVFVYV